MCVEMEQIKRKLASLKDEREAAIEKAENAEMEKKEADERANRASLYCLKTRPHTTATISLSPSYFNRKFSKLYIYVFWGGGR